MMALKVQIFGFFLILHSFLNLIGAPKNAALYNRSFEEKKRDFYEKLEKLDLNNLRAESNVEFGRNTGRKSLNKYSRYKDRDVENEKQFLLQVLINRISKNISVNRAKIYRNSFEQLRSATVNQLLHGIEVTFVGEKSEQESGIRVDWLSKLAKDMFNPSHGLFMYHDETTYAIGINPLAPQNMESEDHFQFIGKITALAICQHIPIDVFFGGPFLKVILERHVRLRDVESAEPQYAKSLEELQKNPSASSLTFTTAEETADGNIRKVELKQNGSNIEVIEENVREYIRLLLEWKYETRVKKHMTNFLNGFKRLIPLDLLENFKVNELELLMCGIPEINMKDWIKNTDIIPNKGKNSKLIKWFWQIVKSFDNSNKIKLLYFVTGSTRLPINGFQGLKEMGSSFKFTVHLSLYKKPNSLPIALVCQKSLILASEYDSKKVLEQKLTTAILESEGF